MMQKSPALRRGFFCSASAICLDGPVMTQKAGKSTAEDYAKGLDILGTIAGSPDTVAAKIQELVDLGINHMHVRFVGEWAGETRQIVKDSAELFAREVMPRFARGSADANQR
jgi:alkanesulfonate monooxygenase SsuD/methylene tetrahydromethanopterin reductase-like flavin-dependent oxidoreductase (luciferase family)